MTALEHLPTCADADLHREEALRPDGTTVVVTRCRSCTAQDIDVLPAPAGWVQPGPRRRARLRMSLPTGSPLLRRDRPNPARPD